MFQVIHVPGVIGQCDLTPASMLKMVWEQNWLSKIIRIEYTLNCKIGDLLHPLPVNDEIKYNESQACMQQDGL